MKKIPQISDSEWEVMNVVWRKSPIAATEIVDNLSGNKQWTSKTIGTFLNRLVKKGALEFKQDGKRYLFKPRVSRDECVRHESQSFLDRVFSGQALPMLAHLAETVDLSKEDIKEFKQILSKKEQR